MMKFSSGLSIFIFLLITLQTCGAVLCPIGNWKPDDRDPPRNVYFDSKELKHCSACVMYYCKAMDGKPSVFKGGCPADYFKDCRGANVAIEFIKEKNSNNLEFYVDRQTSYFSGCSGYCNGTACIIEKYIRFHKDGNKGNVPKDKETGWFSRIENDPVYMDEGKECTSKYNIMPVPNPYGIDQDDTDRDLRYFYYLNSSKEMKECSACVMYFCIAGNNQNIKKGGCSGDYFKDCQRHKVAIDLVKEKNSNKLEFLDPYITSYYSGCSRYCNGTACIIEKYLRFQNDRNKNKIPKVKYGETGWGWYSRIGNDPVYIDDGKECTVNDDATPCDIDPNFPYQDCSSRNLNYRSASKGQDGTLKQIGIFLITFIFAAWIY